MDVPDIDTALQWRGRTVRDPDGEKIGTLGDVYLDQETDRPAWGGVRTGLFGRGESLIPLGQVTASDDGDLRVPHARDVVKDAPRVDPDVALDADEEERLFAYYERSGTAATIDRGTKTHEDGSSGRSTDRETADPARNRDAARTPDPIPDGVAADDDAALADDGDPATMIRSEEEVVVKGGPMRPAERVRLKKVLVTDEVEQTVPVRREVVQLEHEPPPPGTVESVEELEERRPHER